MSLADPNRTSPLLRLEHVCRIYEMGDVSVEVLRDVSFEIHRGEFLAIVGPSGSGKTTVLNLIGGLDQPTAGDLWYVKAGMMKSLVHATPAELTEYRRLEVGFVFQLYNLIPNLTARENVLVAAEIVPQPLDVDEVLRLVGLADRADHFPSQLSGGEQQRVAIARAVAKNPALLLCDEPTGALDQTTGKLVLRLLVDLHRELHTTIVVITHNMALAKVAERTIVLSSGSIAEIHENPHPLPPEEVSW
jgi:putative ABC transport system ATP-binding protein